MNIRMFCWLLLGIILACAQAQGADSASSCADLAQITRAVRCGIDFARYRLNDPRLDQLEAGGGNMFNGSVHAVSSVAELNSLSDKLRPGDRVILKPGKWSAGAISFRGEGSTEHPILLMAESPNVVLSGTATGRFWGRNIVVQGLTFRAGTADRDNFIVVELGSGVQRPCDACIVNRITIDNYNSAPADRIRFKVLYLVLQGRDITVANSRFLNLRNIGVMVHADNPTDNECPSEVVQAGKCAQRLLFTRNVAVGVSSGERLQSSFGKGKVIEIGGGQTATADAYSVLDGNLFEEADAGTNTVSIKESNVIVRSNIFRDNLGTLNLRSSNDVLIENNEFDGSEKPGMGGVLVQGQGHWIINNEFKDLSAPLNDYQYPISISYGSTEELADNEKDYARAKEIVIAGNHFSNVVSPSIMAGVYPDADRGRLLPPEGLYIQNNRFVFSNGAKAQALTTPPDAGTIVGTESTAPADVHLLGNQVSKSTQ